MNVPGKYLYHITNDGDVIDLVFEHDLSKYGLSISDFEMFKSFEDGSSKTVEGAVTEKKQSNVEYCAELIASGLSKEEVYKAIAKKYTDVGKDEVFATKRAKSIYATTVKLATVEPVVAEPVVVAPLGTTAGIC